LLRFHCVQAQFIQESLDGAFTAFKRSLSKNLWMALSLCSSAASRIGLTQSPLKTSASLMFLLLHSHRRIKASFMRLCECKSPTISRGAL
jgi:hypothetical protein